MELYTHMSTILPIFHLRQAIKAIAGFCKKFPQSLVRQVVYGVDFAKHAVFKFATLLLHACRKKPKKLYITDNLIRSTWNQTRVCLSFSSIHSPRI